jgi:short-subunit dehydrogenase
MNREFVDRYGPWALIAGASDGTGAEFARQLASCGLNVSLLARRLSFLEGLAEEVRSVYGVMARISSIDLTDPALVAELDQFAEGIEVGLVVYNAGSDIGSDYFIDRPVEDALHLVDLNCRGPVVLAHKFGREMAARRRGGIILMGSIAGGAGSAHVAVYSATKAFDRTLAEALWVEFGKDGVDVLAATCGLIDTPTNRKLGIQSHLLESGMTSSEVARECIAALPDGPVRVIGEANREANERYLPTDRGSLATAMSENTAGLFGTSVPERMRRTC